MSSSTLFFWGWGGFKGRISPGPPLPFQHFQLKHTHTNQKLSIQDSQAGGNHQFYGVLSPTGRYVMAAILKESPASGTVSPGVMRKIRDLADKMEVYESRAGAGGLLVKIEALLKNGN